MRLTLNSALFWWIFAPLWLLLVLGGGSLLLGYLNYQTEQQLIRGQSTLESLAPGLAAKLKNPERLQHLEILADQLMRSPEVRAFAVYDAQQRSLLHVGPSMHPLADHAHERWALESRAVIEARSVRFIQPIYSLPEAEGPSHWFRATPTRELMGWAEMEYTLVPLRMHRNRVFLLAAVLVSGLLLINLLTSYYLSRHIKDALERGVRRLDVSADEPQESHTVRIVELEQAEQKLKHWSEKAQSKENALRQSIQAIQKEAAENLETIEIKNIELDRARNAALQASRVKSEFLANVSHEIRTPLNSIVGFSNLLARSSYDVRQKEYISHIQGAAETMLGIINDILDLSKIEAGMMVFEAVGVDLCDLMDDTLALMAPQAHRQRLDLVGVVYDDVPLQVKTDPLRIKQLLSNLVSNALKFTPQGEVIVRIQLEDEYPKHPEVPPRCWVRFSVTDTGIGLDEIQRKKLFRAFSQADMAQPPQIGGTGLGLAICKQLVQQMGGEIDLTSVRGEGSTFWFSLPLTQVVESQPAELWLSGKTLGIVESHSLTRQIWTHQLRRWGARVVAWDHPEKLMNELKRHQPAAVVVGLNLHQAQDPNWLKPLSQLQHWRVPCLQLVNSSDPAVHVELRRSVSDYLLLKPIARTKLREVLAELLGASPGLSTSYEVSRSAASQREISLSVLAVDDTPSNLLLLSTLLEHLGMTVTPAASAEEALELVEQGLVPDLLLVDIQMPGMNGDELARCLRERGGVWQRIPILALTAHAVSLEKESWLQAGINDVMIKPLDESRLIINLERWLGRSITAQPRLISDPSEADWQACPVDRGLGIRLAAGRHELADELLDLLLNSLEASRDAIQAALRAKDDVALMEAVHRLHGATRYCGALDLAQTTEALETQMKSGQEHQVAQSLERVFYEIDRLLDWREREYCQGWHALG